MASSGPIDCMRQKGNNIDMSPKLDTLLRAVSDLQKSQDGMRHMFESKLEKFKTYLVENIDTKVRPLRDKLSMDLSRESNRIDQY